MLVKQGLDDRYRICPQLAEYDRLLPTLAPYLIFHSPRSFRSAVVNTDEAGFRVSRDGVEGVDTMTWPARRPGAIVLGGSFVFGVGASSDAGTLVSHLNGVLPYSFLNLGIRAGNSTQELVAALPFLERAEFVIVCSGINNLLVNLQSQGKNDLFGPFFEEGHYESLRQCSVAEAAGRVSGSLGGLAWKDSVLDLFGRVWRRVADRRRVIDETSARFMGSDCDRHLDRAIELQRRDLRMLARGRRRNSRILFAAQPFAPCCAKSLSPEERALFEASDRLGGSAWQNICETLTHLWPRYVHSMRQICIEEDVLFADLNTLELTGWSFVDRIHMTDNGYHQVAQCLVGQCVS